MILDGLNPVGDSSKKSLVSRAEESLLEYIRSNSLTSGDILPSQSTLAKLLGVSISTLREALSRLEAHNVIRVEHGKGTYIESNSDHLETRIDLNLSLSQMIKEQGMIPGTRNISVEMEPLPKVFWNHFENHNLDDKFLCVRRVRTADEKPFAYSVGYLSNKFNQYSDFLSGYYGSLYEFIKNQTDETISVTNAVIYSERSNNFLANKLEVEPGSPLLVIRQIHSNSQGDTLIASRETFSHSYLRLEITLSHI